MRKFRGIMSFVQSSRKPGVGGDQAAEDSIRSNWAEAQHAELVRRLTGDFAHETLQPLAAISNYLSAWRITLSQSGSLSIDPSTQLVWLGELQDAANGAVDAVRRFRDFATLGYWHRDEPWELSGWLRQAMLMVKMTHRSSGVELQWDLSPDQHEVPGGGHRLPRILVAIFYHLLQFPAESVHSSRHLLIRTLDRTSAAFLTLELKTGFPAGGTDPLKARHRATVDDWEARMREIVEYAALLGVTIVCRFTASAVELTLKWQTTADGSGESR